MCIRDRYNAYTLGGFGRSGVSMKAESFLNFIQCLWQLLLEIFKAISLVFVKSVKYLTYIFSNIVAFVILWSLVFTAVSYTHLDVYKRQRVDILHTFNPQADVNSAVLLLVTFLELIVPCIILKQKMFTTGCKTYCSNPRSVQHTLCAL